MKHIKWSILFGTVLGFVLGTGSVSASTGYVTADLLNVRTSMSTDAEVVDTLEYGDAVTITYGPEDGWCEIYHNGDCYYVSAAFISGTGVSSYDYDYDYDYDDDYDYDYDDYDYDDGYSDSGDSGYDDYYDNYDDYDSDEYDGSGSSSGTYLGNFTLTAYCNCAECCGTAGNATASGVYPTSGHTVAMGGVPFGTQLLINGTVYTVEDRGTPYGHVDIYFDSHSEALAFGMQSAEVYQIS